LDNLILTRVAAVLHDELVGCVLEDLREEPPHRFRLRFVRDDRRRSVVVSLNPAGPWIGRPAARSRSRGKRAYPFAASAIRALRGRIVEAVVKPPGDRRVHLRFSDGQALVAELGVGANLIRLDSSANVVELARRPRSARKRLVAGEPYRPRPLPPTRLDPFVAAAEEIDTTVGGLVAAGAAPVDALVRVLFGVGRAVAEMVVVEAAATARRPADVLCERLRLLAAGELDPVIEATATWEQDVPCGRLDPSRIRLLPWEPAETPRAPWVRQRGEDAAATAGLYHESLETSFHISERARGLRELLEQEIRRVRRSAAAVAGDIDAFHDPEQYRRYGEALLAGLVHAQRSGDQVLVPDPYDESGAPLAIPLRAGVRLQDGANALFRRYRRGRRGLEQSQQRARSLEARRRQLVELVESIAIDGSEAIERLEKAMRDAGIPVGLEPVRRDAASPARAERPRLEGVRLFLTRDGLSAMIGKSARDNDRLTFRLAGPEDFWFHALGVAGAHVIVRNDRRLRQPPRASLLEAAAAAAWFSEARSQPQVDVQWTRRKYVRRRRGAPAGTVVVKRSETVRIRPAMPESTRERFC